MHFISNLLECNLNQPAFSFMNSRSYWVVLTLGLLYAGNGDGNWNINAHRYMEKLNQDKAEVMKAETVQLWGHRRG